jgi:type I restriction enzyme R subunit
MDAEFQDVFSDYNIQERLAILGYGSRDAYLESKTTIEAKAKDMVAHYVKHVFPNGYKAQIVATSREAAVRYKGYVDAALRDTVAALEHSNPQMLDVERLRRLQTDVVISGSHNDELHLKPYTDEAKHKATIKSFKLPFDSEEEGVRGDMGIVIVNNMLLTGFDAPVEQVMYLDKIIVAHTLLQAIARVNRVAGTSKEKKYWMC